MWNIILTLIVLIVIFMLNPLRFVDFNKSAPQEQKTRSEVNKVVDETTYQVERARQIQREAQEAQQN